jgi:DNA excision repair protein ERCC-1
MASANEPIEIDANTKSKSKSSIGSIIVSARQRGNPILKSIRLVPWEFSDTIVPDYILGLRSAALYLSLRYHTLNPNYVHERLKLLGPKSFELRILLVQVDIAGKGVHFCSSGWPPK